MPVRFAPEVRDLFSHHAQWESNACFGAPHRSGRHDPAPSLARMTVDGARKVPPCATERSRTTSRSGRTGLDLRGTPASTRERKIVIPRERERLLRNEPDTQNEPDARPSRNGGSRVVPTRSVRSTDTSARCSPARDALNPRPSNVAARARIGMVMACVLLGFWRCLIGE